MIAKNIYTAFVDNTTIDTISVSPFHNIRFMMPTTSSETGMADLSKHKQIIYVFQVCAF